MEQDGPQDGEQVPASQPTSRPRTVFDGFRQPAPSPLPAPSSHDVVTRPTDPEQPYGRNATTSLGGLVGVMLVLGIPLILLILLMWWNTPSTHKLPEIPSPSQDEKRAREAVNTILDESGRLFGPLDGAIQHTSKLSEDVVRTGVKATDFVVEARFFPPSECTSTDSWDFGFIFRESAAGRYTLELSCFPFAPGSWWLRYDDERSHKWLSVSHGTVQLVNRSEGLSSLARFAAKGEEGYLFLNEKYIETVNLSSLVSSGEISAAVGFDATRKQRFVGTGIVYQGLTVWAAEP